MVITMMLRRFYLNHDLRYKVYTIKALNSSYSIINYCSSKNNTIVVITQPTKHCYFILLLLVIHHYSSTIV